MQPTDFWAQVSKRGRDDCWLWNRWKDKDGYGQIRRFGRKCRAHRVAYELTRGPIPKGRFVLHSCDNPSCVNPQHLWIGTHTDNVRDMMNKGRNVYLHGERNPHSKLTNEVVLEIRNAVGSSYSIARRFNISQSNISRIRARKTWPHV